MKDICLLGATGSIGKNCLDIVARFPDLFNIQYLSAHRNMRTLYEIARRVRPLAVAFSGERLPRESEWRKKFTELGIQLLTGRDALIDLAGRPDYHILVNAVVGVAGLKPTLAAIEQGKTIALANKETLVTAGELVMKKADDHRVPILPIDSEHSALWQCLVGEKHETIARLILTASGGPCRELPLDRFKEVTVEQALKHPNWKMGRKITIDSATLMNKGLEVIEAYWLFRIPIDRIQVLIHPQSIIHSMVEFIDGSIKAQLGLPDMRLPIQYALSYPDRLPNDLPRMDFKKCSQLTFIEPDYGKFRALRLAYAAVQEGGTAPAVLNAANEEAVHAFLHHLIRFDEIPEIVEAALEQHHVQPVTGIESVLEADRWAREFVKSKYTHAGVS